MDNNYDSQRPRRRVTKETLRKRQITALCIIALIVLLIVILIAKGCTKDTKKNSNTTPASTTTTTTVSTTDPALTTAPITTTETTTVNTSGFKLDKYSVYLEVGETDMPFVEEYPEGSTEADELWSSEDESIATVDAYGHITAIAPGETYIILKSAADQTKSVQVKVKVADDGSTSAEETITTVNAEPQL